MILRTQKINFVFQEPETIKTDLTSVRHFIDFGKAERNNIMKDQNISQINILIGNWRNTLRKEAQEKQPKKYVTGRQNFPAPEEILNFGKVTNA